MRARIGLLEPLGVGFDMGRARMALRAVPGKEDRAHAAGHDAAAGRTGRVPGRDALPAASPGGAARPRPNAVGAGRHCGTAGVAAGPGNNGSTAGGSPGGHGSGATAARGAISAGLDGALGGLRGRPSRHRDPSSLRSRPPRPNGRPVQSNNRLGRGCDAGGGRRCRLVVVDRSTGRCTVRDGSGRTVGAGSACGRAAEGAAGAVARA